MKELTQKLKSLVAAGYPCIALVTHEEERAHRLVKAIAHDVFRRVYTWSLSRGWHDEDGGVSIQDDGIRIDAGGEEDQRAPNLPERALTDILESCRGRECIFVFKDLQESLSRPLVARRLKDVLTAGERWTVILIASSLSAPPLLEKEVATLDVPLPDAGELRGILMSHLRTLAVDKGGTFRVPKELVERVLKAALGLTERQADCVFRRSITDDNAFTESDLDLIAEEKRQIVQRTGVLEFCKHDETLGGVGGLESLKSWLTQRGNAFSEDARTYGLPEPKGVLLLGVQGCGKSLVSKAISAYWHLPLLRLDVGALFSKFIGKTEENLRTALRTAEAISPTVLWLDEIEKAFAGVSGSGQSDGGTTIRLFGSFLTWMQEKKKPVFVVAAANSVEHLPPELLRKGRFDEIFFVDLPTARERQEIFEIHLERKNRPAARYHVHELVKATEGFSGAEIEQAVVDAMYSAYPQGRDFTTTDILAAATSSVPLSKTQHEKIDALRQWARGRARWATQTD